MSIPHNLKVIMRAWIICRELAAINNDPQRMVRVEDERKRVLRRHRLTSACECKCRVKWWLMSELVNEWCGSTLGSQVNLGRNSTDPRKVEGWLWMDKNLLVGRPHLTIEDECPKGRCNLLPRLTRLGKPYILRKLTSNLVDINYYTRLSRPYINS